MVTGGASPRIDGDKTHGQRPAGGAFAHRAFQRIARWCESGFPASVNPIPQIGAYANLNFIIALATGVLLLFWYKPSLHDAYGSLLAMESRPWLAGLIRSLHRYSSDACVLLVAIHGLEALLAGRFQRPRALAWMTGILLAVLIWAEGWLGYWLVWDDRGLAIADSTARLLDRLPFFEEPISRSFLIAENLSSLFFFVIFFIHMLMPLGFGIGLWLHVTRVNRPKFITGARASAAMLAALIAIAYAFPARAGSPADLSLLAKPLRLDLYFMAPLLGSQSARGWIAAWLMAGAGLAAFLIPYWKGRMRARKPSVAEDKCIGCLRCYEDCPFNAISMIPDEKGELKARIDPDACLACGNCVGACNPHAVEFPEARLEDAERRIRAWFPGKSDMRLAFLCANSAAGSLSPDPETGLCPQLPGYHCLAVPCSGWILPRLLEFAARGGCQGALIAGCGPGTPTHRLGNEWTLLRLMGKRMPSLNLNRIEGMEIRYAFHNRGEESGFLAQARGPGPARRNGSGRSRLRQAGTVAISAAVLAAALWGGNRAPSRTGDAAGRSQLVVSLLLAASHVKEGSLDSAEQMKLPVHMRGAREGSRERRDVTLELRIDGEARLLRAFPPRGFFKDGAGAGIETLPLAPGSHRVEIKVAESGNPQALFEEARTLLFREGRREVVRVENRKGILWP
jgi:ferredoxin